MPKADFRADPSSDDSERPVAGRCHHSAVPDVVTGLPLPLLINQVGVHALEFHQGRESPRYVQSDDPAQAVGLLGEVSDFEGYLLASFELDFRSNRILSDFLPVDDLAVDFHDIVGRSSVTGSELVDTRLLDLNESPGHLRATSGVRGRAHAPEGIKLQGLGRFHGVVVRLRIVVPLVD